MPGSGPIAGPSNATIARTQPQENAPPPRAHAQVDGMPIQHAAPGAVGAEVAHPPRAADSQSQMGDGSVSVTQADVGRIHVDLALRSVRRFGYSNKNDAGILDAIGNEGLANHGVAFKERCDSVSMVEKLRVADQLHYSKEDAARVPSELRLIVRGALVMAYAKNASIDQLRRLRRTLESATPALREAILQELRKPGTTYAEISLEKIEPARVHEYVRELRAANEANVPPNVPNSRRRKAYEERDSMLNAFAGMNPRDVSLFRLSCGSKTVALANFAYEGAASKGRDGQPALGITHVVTHPEARGVAAVIMETAVQESMKARPGAPCVVLNAANRDLWDLYRERYGFASDRPFSDSSASGAALQLQPGQSAHWQNNNGQYSLRLPADMNFTFPRNE